MSFNALLKVRNCYCCKSLRLDPVLLEIVLFPSSHQSLYAILTQRNSLPLLPTLVHTEAARYCRGTCPRWCISYSWGTPLKKDSGRVNTQSRDTTRSCASNEPQRSILGAFNRAGKRSYSFVSNPTVSLLRSFIFPL